MKTLADMTPEERAECVGMWCYIFDREPEPPVAEGIIAGYRESDDGRTVAVVDHPHPDAGKWGHGLNEVSPRFDLPRAWNPDGNPVKGDWEEAKVCLYGDDGLDVHDPDGNSLDVSEFTNADELYKDGQVVGRRFVTKWEVQP